MKERLQGEAEVRASLCKRTLLVICALNISLGGFNMGYNLSVLNPMMENISHIYGWNGAQDETFTGLLSGAVTFGAVIGAYLGGGMAKRFGGTKTMIACNIFFFIGGSMLSIVEVFPVMLIDSLRGTLGAFQQVMGACGNFVAAALGIPLPNPDHQLSSGSQWWRYMFIFSALIGLFQIITLALFFRFETPRYYCERDEVDKARNVLRKFQTDREVEESINGIMHQVEEQRLHPDDPSQKISEYFTGRYKRQFFVGAAICIAQMLTGSMALMFYSTYIFSQGTSLSHHEAIVTAAYLNMAYFLSAIVAIPILHHFSRRAALLAGFAAIAIDETLLGVFSFMGNDGGQKATIIIFFVVYQLSIGTILWLYNAEILPAKGLGLATLVLWSWAFVIALITKPMVSHLKVYGTFWIFAGFSAVSLIFIFFRVPETKGMSRPEIDAAFRFGARLPKDRLKTLSMYSDTEAEVNQKSENRSYSY